MPRRKTVKKVSSPVDEINSLFDQIETIIKDKFQMTKERQLCLTNLNNAKAWSTHMISVEVPTEEKTIDLIDLVENDVE